MNNIATQQIEKTPQKIDLDKSLATIASVLLLSALIIIAITPAATGREFTVYDSYPFYFWILIIASAGCGMGILIHQAFSTEKTGWWLAGLCIVLATNSVFLGLPFFHGYGFWSEGDAMSHTGAMIDIMETGHIGDQNFYPGLHVLGASLLDVTEISRLAMNNLLFVSWNAIYLLNVYLLATVVAKHRGQALLITALASPLVFASCTVTIYPSYLSLYMIPLILYFLHRKTNSQEGQFVNILIVVLLALAMVFIHPFTSLFAIALLIALDVSKYLYRQITSRKGLSLQKAIEMPETYTIPLLIFTVWILWYLTANDFDFIEKNIKDVYDFLFYGGGRAAPFQAETSDLGRTELSIFQIMELGFYRYGAIFMYLAASLLSVLAVIKSVLNKKSLLEPVNLTYAILFLAGLGMAIFSLLAQSGEYQIVRIARTFLLISPFIIGLITYEMICKDKGKPVKLVGFKANRKMSIAFITTLALAVSLLSTLNVYGSGKTGWENYQITRMEITGSEWFTDHRSGSVDVVTDNVAVGRFDEFYLGIEGNNFDTYWYPPEVPSHFGYDVNSSITDTVESDDAYLATSERGRIYVMYHREIDRHLYPQYTDEDYVSLRADPAVAQIYANEEYEIWRVYGIQE